VLLILVFLLTSRITMPEICAATSAGLVLASLYLIISLEVQLRSNPA